VARAAGGLIERAWQRSGRAGEPPLTAFVAEQLGTAHWFDQRRTRVALDWIPRIGLDEGFRRLAASF
jgi:nucleoside-diphosphate-sugar epimerase